MLKKNFFFLFLSLLYEQWKSWMYCMLFEKGHKQHWLIHRFVYSFFIFHSNTKNFFLKRMKKVITVSQYTYILVEYFYFIFLFFSYWILRSIRYIYFAMNKKREWKKRNKYINIMPKLHLNYHHTGMHVIHLTDLLDSTFPISSLA